MTDVGATTVEQLLFGADPEAARQGLLAMASTTAALHRCEPPPRGRRTWTVGTHGLDWSAVSLGVTALNLPSPAAAEQDVTEVLRELAVGSRFVHGDLRPNNAVIGTDGRCRLVDLEGASAQHLGVDACMLRFPFAWYGRWAQLPTSVLMEIQAMYQQEVQLPPHVVTDAIAVGCVAMTILRLERLPVIADPEQSPEQRRRRLIQIVSTLDAAVHALNEADRLTGLSSWMENLNRALRDRWDEARLEPPLFPAFAS